jgi:hypothetical protein
MAYAGGRIARGLEKIRLIYTVLTIPAPDLDKPPISGASTELLKFEKAIGHLPEDVVLHCEQPGYDHEENDHLHQFSPPPGMATTLPIKPRPLARINKS